MTAALGTSTVAALNAGDGIGLEALTPPSQHTPQRDIQGEHTEQPQPLPETAVKSTAGRPPAQTANFSAAAHSELNSAKPSHQECPQSSKQFERRGEKGKARERVEGRAKGTGVERSSRGRRAGAIDNFFGCGFSPPGGEGGNRGPGNRQRDWVERALSHITRGIRYRG
jgi:hypothetical protein